MPVLPRLDNYDDIFRQFRWQVPERYNIGVDVCDRWAAREPDRLAILLNRPRVAWCRCSRRRTVPKSKAIQKSASWLRDSKR